MPKQLINLIGILVAAGILLVAIVVGVLPQLTAAGDTNGQASQVAAANSAYQARINQLQRQKEDLPKIKATVAQLHRQIPAQYQLDDVFQLVATSAAASKATITSVTAGEPAPFEVRTAPVPAGEPTPTPGTSASPVPSPAASSAGTTSEGQSGAAVPAGRTQIDVVIQVTLADAAAASDFLDGLRAGPRLLANITSTATTTGTGVDLQVSALAFAEPSTTTASNGGN